MSVATKTGDLGTTGLMYNRRVPKCDPRVETIGSVDELNAALGVVRATAGEGFLREQMLAIQRDLVILLGELATLPEDAERYVRDGFPVVTQQMTAQLDEKVREIESRCGHAKGWAVPGGNLSAATLDVARVACRRAERRVCGLHKSCPSQNPEIIAYLNRLSDLLWLLARWAENPESSAGEEAPID